jgi:hypothetical protein
MLHHQPAGCVAVLAARTLSALRQRVTQRVCIRTPDCGLPIRLVVAKQLKAILNGSKPATRQAVA